MNTCTSEQYRQYLETFSRPAPTDRQVIRQRTLTQIPWFLYLLVRSKAAPEEVKDDY